MGDYTSVFGTKKAWEGDITQDMQFQEEMGFKRRAEKRQEEAVKQVKADKEKKDKQELIDKWVKPLTAGDTGSKSLNEIQGKLLLAATNEYIPLMNVLNDHKSTDEQKIKATVKLSNINKLPENMAAMTEKMTARDIAHKKGVLAGTEFSNPEYDTNFSEGWETKILGLDDNGLPVLVHNNTDGTKDAETYNNIQNGQEKYSFQTRFDRDKELLGDVTKIQSTVNSNPINGGTIQHKVTGIDPETLKTYVANKLKNQDGTPNEVLKSFARDAGVPLTIKDDKGNDIPNTVALDKLVKGYANDIVLHTKGGVEDTPIDTTSRERLAFDRSRAKKADEKDKIMSVVTPTNDIAFIEDLKKTDEKGKPLGKISKKGVLPNGLVFSKSIAIKNTGGERTDINNLSVNSISINKNHEIIFTGDVLDEKASGAKSENFDTGEVTYQYGAKYKKVTRRATGETLGEIASALKYKSTAALKSHLLEINKEKGKPKIDY
jgi:hypothetical protein